MPVQTSSEFTTTFTSGNEKNNNNDTNVWMIVSIITIALLIFLIICVAITAMIISKKRNLSKRKDKIETSKNKIQIRTKIQRQKSGTRTITRTGRGEGDNAVNTGGNESSHGVLSLANQDSLVVEDVEMEGKNEGDAANETLGGNGNYVSAHGQLKFESIHVENIVEEVIDETAGADDNNNKVFDEKLKDDIGVEDVMMDDIVHHMSTQK